MPAANIIEIQEMVPNSGSSSSLPSLMWPYRLNIRKMQIATKPQTAAT